MTGIWGTEHELRHPQVVADEVEDDKVGLPLEDPVLEGRHLYGGVVSGNCKIKDLEGPGFLFIGKSVQPLFQKSEVRLPHPDGPSEHD